MIADARQRPPDTDRFLAILETAPEAHDLFDRGRDIVVARAPGRLDLMGGFADYSGSLVLELPIREATFAAVQTDPRRRIRIISMGAGRAGRSPDFDMPIADLEEAGEPAEYETARRYFRRDESRQWAAYAAGVFLVLMRERGVRFERGARVLIASDVPEGRGVSSSAALEVAVMQAVATAFEIPLAGHELALLCQKVENFVVGAPCGVMDQITAACGEAGRLLALLCQPAEIRGLVPIPPDLAVWGIDSGVRHFVGGTDYRAVRVGAFMGYRMIAEMAGLAVAVPPGRPDGRGTMRPGPVRILDPVYGGYLANVTPEVFEERFEEGLPEHIRGRDFLARYCDTTDPVTEVDPDATYAVRAPTAHPIHEHARVSTFARLLAGPPDERRWRRLGQLMYESHASYSACGLGCPATDRLVEMVRQVGPAGGLFGAKITGGGSGGTVAVLGRPDAEPAVREIARRYAAQAGAGGHVFAGSSPGALAFGHLRVGPGSS